MKRVLVVATSRKTRGGITSVIKAHETGEQWKKFHCHWVQTHRDGPTWRKLVYLGLAWIDFLFRLPFCELVHIHSSAGASAKRKTPFARLAKMMGKKVIVHFHPPTERVLVVDKWRIPTYKLFSFADKILVLSPRWEKLIREAFSNENFGIEVLYNPCPIVHRLRMKDDSQYILFAGTICERKGYQWLLKAFAKVCRLHPEWKLKFAGNGEIAKAKELQATLGIPKEQVEYLGWISGIIKDEVFNNATIYCLPSWGEGFPMGVLDAMAYGVPVVTTPVGGIEDVLVDKQDCMIAPVGDVDKLAQSLNTLMKHADVREQLVHMADSHVNKEFNITNINNQLDKIYSDLLCHS